MHITSLTLNKLLLPTTGRITYNDDSLPGFGIRVSASGNKSFVLLIGRARKRVTLGKYPIITLAEARGRARELIAQRVLRKEEVESIKFDEAFPLFVSSQFTEHAVKAATRNRVKSLYRRFFLPAFRSEYLHLISRHEVARVVDRLSRTPGQARNTYQVIKQFFGWAQKRRYILSNPCDGIDAPSPVRARDRVLSKSEIRDILTHARTYQNKFGQMLELLLLTGQRSGEIGALRGEWIDFERRTLTLPSEITKNKRLHVMPLGPRAIELLSKHAESGLLFPGRGTDNPTRSWGPFKSRFDKRCKLPHWRIHDLRRTFATNLAELGVPVPVTEKLLNHVSGSTSGIVGVYQRYTYEKEGREAIERWEAYIANLMKDPVLTEVH